VQVKSLLLWRRPSVPMLFYMRPSLIGVWQLKVKEGLYAILFATAGGGFVPPDAA